MKRLDDISAIELCELGVYNTYACISGRMKYDDGRFSIKCRITDQFDFPVPDKIHALVVYTGDQCIWFATITTIEIRFDSYAISLSPPHESNTKYLIHGTGELLGT